LTAILVLRQRSSVHLMCDLAAYEKNGILRSITHRKCVAMPEISAAVACTGPAMLGSFFGDRLPEMFKSFDDLVKNGNECLPELFQEYADDERDGDANSTFYIIGWHSAQNRPAAYAMDLWTNTSSRIAQVLENSSPAANRERFKLDEQLAAGTPLPGPDLLAAAGWSMPDDENTMNPEIGLLHLMEIQRHEEVEGAHWVGGGAFLTSIDRNGVTQRIVHRWREDKVGEFIKPLPIDYDERFGGPVALPKQRRTEMKRKMKVVQ
jgi:hypothetical protein